MTEEAILAAPERGSRLVLEYTQGDRKGLFQIVGTSYGAPPPMLQGPFKVSDGPEVEFASLIRVTPRAVYYREVYDAVRTGRLDDHYPELPFNFNENQE